MTTKLQEVIQGKGEVRGFTFKKSYENSVGYVYLVSSGNSSWYEAFAKKTVPICLDFDNRVYSEEDDKEVYPKAKDFGVWAWTVGSLDKGLDKLK